MVNGVTYNMTGIFTSSRGQLVVEQSPVDTVNCRISSSLTVLNVQLNSQGVYTCILLHNNVTLSSNRSLMLDVESSTEGTHACDLLAVCNCYCIITLLHRHYVELHTFMYVMAWLVYWAMTTGKLAF